ncbi:hypothetical protein HKX48_000080 [Thoreauomyces humboldtii]|nr:hypothetical protein HKX48_000080 [Thoreauomyces humboldtii]
MQQSIEIDNSDEARSGFWNNEGTEEYDVIEEDLAPLRVRIADSMYCVLCRRQRPRGAFSQVQQARDNPQATDPWWLHLHKNSRARWTGQQAFQTSCNDCTATQETHMRCHSCLKVKLKTEFSKNQRCNGEKAWCITCISKKMMSWKRPMDDEDPDADSAATDATSGTVRAVDVKSDMLCTVETVHEYEAFATLEDYDQDEFGDDEWE